MEQSAEHRTWAAEHVGGALHEEILQGLRENFVGECTEVGMYLAMARVAHREGYPGDRPVLAPRLPWKRLSTPPSSLSCWARS